MKNNKIYTVSEVEKLNINDVKYLYSKFINPNLIKTLNKLSFINDRVTRAQGQYIYCGKRKILDLTGGYGVLTHGHNHKRIIKSRINFQNNKKMEVHKNFLSPYMAALSNNIANLLPANLNKVFLPNSGAEANEGALKMAYKYHNGKRKFVLHSDISFHGKLLGTGSISNSSEIYFKFQGLENTEKFIYNDINSLDKLIEKKKKDIYAIIVEPFSASTLTPLSSEFAQRLKNHCERNNIVLIFDEVFTSWSKTGKMFYFEYLNVIPDILTFSKSFGGGKSSISGYVIDDKIYKKTYNIKNQFNIHSTTYNGFGEECVTAIEAINIILDEDYCKKAIEFGIYINKKLNQINEKYSLNLDIRGIGSLQGFKINFKKNLIINLTKFIPGSSSSLIEKIIYTSIVEELYSKYSILTTFSSNKEIVFWILPPICTSKKDLDNFFNSLDNIFKEGLNKIAIKLIKKLVF